MPLQIEDGVGSGRKALVTTENRLGTDSVTQTQEHHANEEEGQAFHLLFEQSPTANDDCILYVENGEDETMIVEGFYLSTDAACELYFQLRDQGTRNGATDLTPVNLNAGSGFTAGNSTFERGADLDGGAATLDGGTEFERYVIRAANTSAFFNFECDVILPKNQTLTLWCSNSAATINGTMVFYLHTR